MDAVPNQCKHVLPRLALRFDVLPSKGRGKQNNVRLTSVFYSPASSASHVCQIMEDQVRSTAMPAVNISSVVEMVPKLDDSARAPDDVWGRDRFNANAVRGGAALRPANLPRSLSSKRLKCVLRLCRRNEWSVMDA